MMATKADVEKSLEEARKALTEALNNPEAPDDEVPNLEAAIRLLEGVLKRKEETKSLNN